MTEDYENLLSVQTKFRGKENNDYIIKNRFKPNFVSKENNYYIIKNKKIICFNYIYVYDIFLRLISVS